MSSRHKPHDWHSASYVDTWVRERTREDPYRVAQFSLMAKLLPITREQKVNIVDLSSGYGPLAKVILEAYPNVTIVVQDFSQPMLDEASKRLSAWSDRVKFVTSNLMEKDWAAEMDSVTVVVSSMGLHNLGAPGRVREIYREVFELLKPGGAFLDFDFVNGAEAATHWMYSGWIAQEDEDDAVGTRAWVDGQWQKPSHYPFPATVDEKLGWLRQSGFTVVDCWWKEMGRAVVGGLKSSNTRYND